MTRALGILAALRVALDGILAGFGIVLVWLLPSMVTSLTLNSAGPGLVVTLAAFGYMGVVAARRRVERDAVARRLLELEAVEVVLAASLAARAQAVDDLGGQPV